MVSVDSFRVPFFVLSTLLVTSGVARAQPTSAPSPWPYGDAPVPASDPASPSSDEPPRPPEPASARFGARGQLVLSGATDLAIQASQWDGSQAWDFKVHFHPVLDYFAIKNLSLGLDLDAGYEDSKGYDASGLTETQTTYLAAGPRVGLNVPFGSAASFWPQVSFDLAWTESTTSSVSSDGTSGGLSLFSQSAQSQTGPTVNLYLPILVHPVPHFFMGAGPYLFHQFGSVQNESGYSVGEQRTTLGGSFLVGGYWGGTPEKASETSSEPPPRPLKQFGERGEVVFSSALTGFVSSSWYAGNKASVLEGEVEVGVDYFVIDSFALGGGVTGGGSNTNNADGTPSSSYSSYGAYIDARSALRIKGPVLLYPRVLLGVAGGSQDQKSSTGDDSVSFTEIWVACDLPVVVEVVPHFFAGFGPSLRRDLANTYNYPSGAQQSVPGVTYGAGAIIGGWL